MSTIQIDQVSTKMIVGSDIDRNYSYNPTTLKSVDNHTASYNWSVLGLSLFSIFGIFGNILVCMTIRRDPALQTKTNYYLFSLAIADLAVCLIVIPLSIIQDFSGWLYNLFLIFFNGSQPINMVLCSFVLPKINIRLAKTCK